MAFGGMVVVGLLGLWWTGVQAGSRNRAIPADENWGDGEPISDAIYSTAVRDLDSRLHEARARLRREGEDSRLLHRIAGYHWQRAQFLALDTYSRYPGGTQAPEPPSEAHYRRWMRAALARDTSGDLREASRAVRRALAHEGRPMRRWWLLRHLSRTECARGRHEVELQALREGLALLPEEPEILLRMARAFGEAGDRVAQENTLERLWQVERSRAAELPPATPGLPGGAVPRSLAVTPPPARPDENVWASTAYDGDEWLQGLCLKPPASLSRAR